MNMRRKHLFTLCVVGAFLLIVGLTLSLTFASPLLQVLSWDRQIRRKESQLTKTAVVQAVGKDLARLCLTDKRHPDWFDDEPAYAPAWTPASVLRLKPSWVQVGEDGARVEFGGGFHHFGYALVRDASMTDSGKQSTWVLRLYREESASETLGKFTLASDDVLSEKDFVDRAMAEFDRRIRAGGSNGVIVIGPGEASASTQRCNFAFAHGQLDRLRRAIHETAVKSPHAWLDVLLAYLIDRKTDPAGASKRLRAWAGSKEGFSRWLAAAYAFDKAHDVGETEKAVLNACRFPADDPDWVESNARFRGYAMCRRLYVMGKYDACKKLCDNLLAYTDSGDYLSGEIESVRHVCDQARSGKKHSALQDPDSALICDPFGGIKAKAFTAIVGAAP